MAYQPKSYKKFVATAATATLVASAIAPLASAASFSDVSDRYKEAVSYLADKGISQGYPNGKFGTDDNIKRQDAAVMIAKALGATKDGKYTDAGFTDVPKDLQWAVNFLVEKKIVSGKAAGKFGANDLTTRGEMSKIIANAYNLVGDATNKFPFTDVSDTFKQYVDALNEAGVAQGLTATKFGTGENVTRGQFALFVFRAETSAANSELASVNAIGVKKIEVKFNKAVDTTKAAITVGKATSNQGISKVTFAEDKKSAVIELNNKLTKGTYTVSVSGLTETALTKDVTVESEAVATVKLLSDKAIIAAANTAEVGYEIQNQYGEAMTTAAPIATSTLGTAVALNGKVTITKTDIKAGEAFTLTLIDSASAKSVSAQLTVAAEAKAVDVTFGSLVDVNNKVVEALKQEDNAKDFYVSVDVKDQYGRKVTNVAALNADLLVTSSNGGVVSAGTFAEVTDADGKKHTTLALDVKDAYGESIITVVSKSTGKAVTYKATVLEATKVDVVKLNAPTVDLIAGGDKVSFPVEATDNKGNVITKASALAGITPSITGATATGAGTFVEKDGKVFYEVQLDGNANTSDRTAVLTVTSSTGKVDTEIVSVKATATPKTIVGLKSTVETAIFAGESVDLKWTDFVIQDQYGRTMTYVADANYDIVATSSNANVTVTSATADDTTKVTLKGAAKGTSSVTLELQKAGVALHTTDVTFRTVAQSEITKYELADVTPLYNDVNYASELTVNGFTADGKKLVIPATEFNVLGLPTGVTFDGTELTTDGTFVWGSDASVVEKTVNLSVVINNTGDTLAKSVVVSRVAPSVSTFEVKEDKKVVTELNLAVATASTVNADDLAEFLVVADQYGKAATVDATTGKIAFADVTTTITPTFTFSSVTNASGGAAPTLTNNGNSSAAVAGLDTGDSLNVTVKAGGKTVTVKVNVK